MENEERRKSRTVPKRIGRFRIEDRIGAGGMGTVYRAFDDGFQRVVAIKFVHDIHATRHDTRERFNREGQAAAGLSHPAIVTIYDSLTWEGQDCLVMEYIEGETLATALADGPFSVQDALPLLREIADGLAAAHEQGLVHRDLKAENVMLTERGRPKILDFGLVKRLDTSEQSLTRDGAVVGTLHCMSPEQVQQQEVDHRSDLFSFGALAYQVLSGVSPFRGEDARSTLVRVIQHRQEPVHEVVPGVPEDLSGLVDRLLEKDPEYRPQNAREVVEALDRMIFTVTSEALRSAAEAPEVDTIVDSSVGDVDINSLHPDGVDSKRTTAMVDPFRKRRPLIALLALVAVAVILLAVSRYLQTSPRLAVAIIDFENQTGNPEDDWLGTAYAEVIGADLGAHDKAHIVDGLRVAEVLAALGLENAPNEEIARKMSEVSRYLDADRIVLGAFSQRDKPSVSLQLYKPRRGGWAAEELSNSRGEFFKLAGQAGGFLRARLPGQELLPDETELRRLFPEEPAAFKAYIEGLRYQRAHSNRKAKESFEAALEVEPDHPILWLHLAEVSIDFGNYHDAEQESDRAKALSAGLPEATRLQISAFKHEVLEEYALAAEFMQQRYELNFDPADSGLLLIDYYLSAGDTKKAQEVYEDLKARPLRESEQGRLDLAIARNALILGNSDEARSWAQKALQRGERLQSPRLTALSYYRLAEIEQRDGRFVDALNYIQNALEYFKRTRARAGHIDSLIVEAIIQADLGRLREAEKRLRSYIVSYQDWGDKFNESVVKTNLALVLADLGRLGEARKLAGEAAVAFSSLESRSYEADALVLQGSIALQAGALDDARQLYERAQVVYENLGIHRINDIDFNLGELLFLQGDLEAAAENFDRVPDEDERFKDDAQRWKAKIQAARGEAKQAVTVLKELRDKSVDADEISALAKAELGNIHLNLAALNFQIRNLDIARDEAEAAEAIFSKVQRDELATLARIVIARVYLAERRDVESVIGTDLMRYREKPSEVAHVRHQWDILQARIDFAEDVRNAEKAIESLTMVSDQATAAGLMIDVFDAELAMIEIEVQQGSVAAARQRYEKLKAMASGWISVAKEGEALLRGYE